MAKEFFVIKESLPVRNATKSIKQILDTEYKKIILKSIVINIDYLKDNHENLFFKLLQKYGKIFDGTLGRYTSSDYTMELKEDTKTYHAKHFRIPKIHEPTLKKEVDRLIKVAVLKKINNSQLVGPTLIIPKKNGTVLC